MISQGAVEGTQRVHASGMEVDFRRIQQALSESDAWWQAIFDGVGIGVVVCDLQGRVIASTPSLQRMLDYSEVELRKIGLAAVTHPEDSPVHLELFTELTKGDRDYHRLEKRFFRKDGKLLRARVTVLLLGSSEGHPSFVAGLVEDITTEKETERMMHLLRAVTTAVNQVPTKETLRLCLEQVCTYAAWPVGHAYMVAEDTPDSLVPMTGWHVDDPTNLKNLCRVTGAATWCPGDGLLGRVVQSGKPEWSADVTADPNLSRAKLPCDMGVRGAVAFPVLSGREVTAVLEFLAKEPTQPDRGLFEVMAQICAQLGTVVRDLTQRRRAEENRMRLREAELRYDQALQLNDDIVQSLSVAKMALELGMEEKLAEVLDQTLSQARSIVTNLLRAKGDNSRPLPSRTLAPGSGCESARRPRVVEEPS